MIGYDTHGQQYPEDWDDEIRCPVCKSDEIVIERTLLSVKTTCLDCGYVEIDDE